ncbi:MAG: hypothetical protein IPG25_14505 [Proteobacteria bacterium]|nr:hypothetical protein [Pseudomonadota bacterium]
MTAATSNTNRRTDSAGARREIVLSATGVSKIYRSGEVTVHALKEVSLELYAGELLVLLGAVDFR